MTATPASRPTGLPRCGSRSPRRGRPRVGPRPCPYPRPSSGPPGRRPSPRPPRGPMPLSMYFSRGQAVHYSADFAARGYNGASHGCVNVRDRVKLTALFDQVKVGDKVVVHW
ncbi:L,D-transpeptidase [Streptomyces massasporeus]